MMMGGLVFVQSFFKIDSFEEKKKKNSSVRSCLCSFFQLILSEIKKRKIGSVVRVCAVLRAASSDQPTLHALTNHHQYLFCVLVVFFQIFS